MGIKKRGTFFLSLHEVLELPTNQIREAHDFTRERSWLILLVGFNEIFQVSCNQL